MSTTSGQDKLANKWRKYIWDSKDKSYMKELPPEDFELNTVTTVNPYVYMDELEAVKKEKEYQERVAVAVKRREIASKIIKKKEKAFIKEINVRSGPSWFQDLSTRQDKKPRRKLPDLDEQQTLFRSLRINTYFKTEKERQKKVKTIIQNLKRLT